MAIDTKVEPRKREPVVKSGAADSGVKGRGQQGSVQATPFTDAGAKAKYKGKPVGKNEAVK